MYSEMQEASAKTTEESREKIRKAVKVLQAPGGTVQQKQLFLMQVKGVSDSEFMEALNIASDGALLASA